MENNKFWIYLGLGVVAALSLKWFSSPESTDVSNRWSIQANLGEEIQYKRSAKDNDRVAGLSERRTTPLTQVKSGATTAAPAAAAKKQDVKAKNVAKKKDDKKKKKKKKPKILGVPETETDSNEDDSEVAAVPAGGSAAPQPLFAGAGQAGNPPTAARLTDWDFLLVTPNHRETTRFINLYQTKQITAEVFYGIVGQMLTDGRTQMRSLGVMALGATPSVTSYEMLVQTIESETGNVKTQATTYLDRTYNRPQAVSILYSVLKKPETTSTVQVQALQNLSSILTNLRQPASNVTPETGETAAPTKSEAVAQQHVLRYFVLLQREVMPLLTQSSDPSIRALAESVSLKLVAVVNTPIVAPVQTVANQ